MDDHRPSPDLAHLPILGVSRRLADAVSDALRDAITDGTFGPGSRLREVALAKHFGVSATPVREALRRLEREGLVAVDPYRGATVATLSAAQLADLYEIHELLECRAVRRAAQAADRDLPDLEPILAEAETLLTEPDQTSFNRLDLAFHRTLNRSGGNPPLAELIEQLHRRIQGVRIRHAGHLPGRPALSHAQHREILEAVRGGDVDRAEALARRHIRSVRDAVMGVLANPSREDVA
jgi:DNA-binding GntR family transcriptional regulator